MAFEQDKESVIRLKKQASIPQAIVLANEMLKKYPKQVSETRILLTELYLAQGQLAQAQGELEHVKKPAEQTANYHELQGKIYRENARVPEAIAAFDKAIKLNSKDPYLFILRGETRDNAKDAIEDFRLALAINSRLLVPWRLITLKFVEQHNLVDALSAIRSALNIRPDDQQCIDIEKYIVGEMNPDQISAFSPPNPFASVVEVTNAHAEAAYAPATILLSSSASMTTSVSSAAQIHTPTLPVHTVKSTNPFDVEAKDLSVAPTSSSVSASSSVFFSSSTKPQMASAVPAVHAAVVQSLDTTPPSQHPASISMNAFDRPFTANANGGIFPKNKTATKNAPAAGARIFPHYSPPNPNDPSVGVSHKQPVSGAMSTSAQSEVASAAIKGMRVGSGPSQ